MIELTSVVQSVQDQPKALDPLDVIHRILDIPVPGMYLDA
jgi:hypothetical protein